MRPRREPHRRPSSTKWHEPTRRLIRRFHPLTSGSCLDGARDGCGAGMQTWSSMRHFEFLDDSDRARLFFRLPEPFDVHADQEVLATALGATLYSPATRPKLADDIARRASQGVTSMVVCLEDSIPDNQVAEAECN